MRIISSSLFASAFLPLLANADCTLTTNINGEYIVASYADLKLVSVGDCTSSDSYRLVADIDATLSAKENCVGKVCKGFEPIGSEADEANPDSFKGYFFGSGHYISGLYINRPKQDWVGLFSYITTNGHVDSIALKAEHVRGHMYVGGLAGELDGTVNAASVTADSVLSDSDYVGGLVGMAAGSNNGFDSAYIANSFASAIVTGDFCVGGLVGIVEGEPILHSYSKGSVHGLSIYTGGLVGSTSGLIDRSFSTSSVQSSDDDVGGLAGYSGDSITNSYATGSVTTTMNYVGGLVGTNGGTISTSYASGSVQGVNSVGALVGENEGNINSAFASGTVTGTGNDVGGLLGFNMNAIDTLSLFLTSAEMKQSLSFKNDSFAHWDFDSTWIIYEEQTTPLLRTFMTPLTIAAKPFSKTYDGKAFRGGNGIEYSLTNVDQTKLLGTLTYDGSAQGAFDVGNYSILPLGLYSDQLGYALTFTNGTLSIVAPISARTKSSFSRSNFTSSQRRFNLLGQFVRTGDRRL